LLTTGSLITHADWCKDGERRLLAVDVDNRMKPGTSCRRFEPRE
jgi:hypothetical protein